DARLRADGGAVEDRQVRLALVCRGDRGEDLGELVAPERRLEQLHPADVGQQQSSRGRSRQVRQPERLLLEGGSGPVAQRQRLVGRGAPQRRVPIIAVEHPLQLRGEIDRGRARLVGGAGHDGERLDAGGRNTRGAPRSRSQPWTYQCPSCTPTTQGSTARSEGAPWVPRYMNLTPRPETTACSSGESTGSDSTAPRGVRRSRSGSAS